MANNRQEVLHDGVYPAGVWAQIARAEFWPARECSPVSSDMRGAGPLEAGARQRPAGLRALGGCTQLQCFPLCPYLYELRSKEHRTLV